MLVKRMFMVGLTVVLGGGAQSGSLRLWAHEMLRGIHDPSMYRWYWLPRQRRQWRRRRRR